MAAVEAEAAAAAAAVAVGAEVEEVAAVEEAAVEEVEQVGVALRRGSASVVVSASSSSSSALVTSPPLSSSVSGTLRACGCGGAHPTQRCFGRLTDAWRHQFPEATEIPCWGELSRAGVAIFDLDFDAILAAMYPVPISEKGDCYRCFAPDPGIETAALGTGEAAALGASEAAALGACASAPSGAGESALSGTTSASASHTFTLDSGASHSFRDRTTLTPLGRPVAVSLADPSRSPVLAHFSTVLPCPAAPSGTLSGLYLPSFSTNLVSGAALQDAGVHQFTPASQRGHERYFLLVVDDYSRYTTIFPLRSKGDVTEVLIDWIRAARVQLKQSFGSDFPLLRLHSNRGGEFSSGLLRAYCRARGIRQTFTLPDSPQRNGIAQRRIGMVMDTGKVGDASAFRVWGSRAFVRNLSADKLSPRAAPCVFLGFHPDAPGWQFYHPTSRRVVSSQDVMFDESVPYYRLFPNRTPSLPPPPLFLMPGPAPVDPLPPQGPAPSGVSQVHAVEPVEVTGDSGAAEGAEPGGADSGGAEHVGAMPGGAEPEGATTGGAERVGATPGGAEPEGATTGGAEPGGAELGGATTGGAEPGGAEPRGATRGGAKPRGAEPEGAGPARMSSGGAEHGGSPGASSERESLSP
ncbi:unnamed protein product [Closterium sp. NIES-65]|nr:unnamed protein product [Closterium sp. NIES-65]